MNDIKKKIIRGVAVLAIAGSAGHFVQQSAAQRPEPEQAVDALAAEGLTTRPTNIETVAASDQPMTSTPEIAPPVTATAPQVTATTSVPDLTMPAEASPPAILPAAAPILPQPVPPLVETAAAVQPSAAPATDCTPYLDLLSDDLAMIGVTLIAPCNGDQEFTLRHAGLVINQTTNSTGSFFAFIPALSRDGAVSVSFKDGQELSGAVEVPALDGLRRVSLIWQAPDAFGIQALEGDALYGDAAAISALNPQTPAPGALQTSGYLTRIGDATDPASLMADVYTYPLGAETDTQVLFEVAVSPSACGRDAYAELVSTVQGQTTAEELVLTLPECDGESGFLVLNNPFQEQSIAALN